MKKNFAVHSTNRPLLKAFFETALQTGIDGNPAWNKDWKDRRSTDYLLVYENEHTGKAVIEFHSHDGEYATTFNLPADWDKALQAVKDRVASEKEPYKPAMEGMKRVTAEQLKQKLSGPIPVRFTFTKKDGQIRHAIGTRYIDNIPGGAAPTGSRKESTTAVSYYDYTVQAWRSLTKDTEIFLDTNF